MKGRAGVTLSREPEPREPEPKLASFHVLLVDNDPASAASTGQCLSDAGYRVSHRTSLVDIETALTQLQPDVVLLDVLMPSLRGKDVEDFLERHPATSEFPVLLSSPMHPAILRRMIVTTHALGVLEDVRNADRLLASMRTYSRWLEMRNVLRQPQTSGTHRMQPLAANFAAEEDTTTELTGNDR